MRDLTVPQGNIAEGMCLLQDELWNKMYEELQQLARNMIELSAEQAFREQIGLDKYEHNFVRHDYRNGYRYRGFRTGNFGYIENIRLPRGRKYTYNFPLFRHYQRRSAACDRAVFTLYLLGHSTRDIKKVFRRVFKDSISAGGISLVLKQLGHELNKYRQQAITERYKAILLDGLWIHARTSLHNTSKTVMLVAMGIKPNGQRQIIGFRPSMGESTHAWEGLINDLIKRGLEVDSNSIIVHDGAPGLIQAIETAFPYAKKQLCVFHHIAGITSKLRFKSNRKLILKDAGYIYKAANYKETTERFQQFIAKWEQKEKTAIKYFRRNFNDTLTYLQFPVEWWPLIKTNNYLERYFRELNRKIYDVGVFPTAKSAENILYLLIADFNQQQLEEKPKFTHLS